jgi:hypothetical protein
MHLLLMVTLAILTIVLVVALLSCIEIGYRVGRKRILKNPDVVAGVNVIEASVFGLLGLMMAFQFSTAQGRLELRRTLIVQEANSIGTAYLRLDLLPPQAQPALRDLFRRYADSRISRFELLSQLEFARSEEKLRETRALQSEIWSKAMAAVQADPNPGTRMLVIPPINDMIDTTTTRTIAMMNHVPGAIIALLLLLAMSGAVLAGHAMAVRLNGRSLLHAVVFSLVIAATFCVMIDLEFPRYGLVRNDDADRALHDTRAGMN